MGRAKMSMQWHVDDIAPLSFSYAEKPERQRFLCSPLIPLQMSEDTCYRQQLKKIFGWAWRQGRLWQRNCGAVTSIQTWAAVLTSISEDFNRLFTWRWQCLEKEKEQITEWARYSPCHVITCLCQETARLTQSMVLPHNTSCVWFLSHLWELPVFRPGSLKQHSTL